MTKKTRNKLTVAYLEVKNGKYSESQIVDHLVQRVRGNYACARSFLNWILIVEEERKNGKVE